MSVNDVTKQNALELVELKGVVYQALRLKPDLLLRSENAARNYADGWFITSVPLETTPVEKL